MSTPSDHVVAAYDHAVAAHDHVVAAHDQSESHRYAVHYPEHGSRPGDPHYVDFDHYHRTTKNDPEIYQCAVGKRRGDFSDCVLDKPLELHHTHIEWALQNEVDLAYLALQYPGVDTPDEVGAWVETAANLEWLCILPGVDVLMADGTERPIEDVQVGDWVVSAEGRSCPVTAVGAKRYRGEVARFGTAALTSAHRMRVPGGWSAAGQVAQEIGMLGADMVRLRCVKQQVLDGVVGAVPVHVVDALGAEQRAANESLHDPSVFHLEAPYASAVHLHANVALDAQVAPGAVMVLPRSRVQSGDAALVGAEAARSSAPVRGPMEALAAGRAVREMVWVAPVAPTVELFSGYVHDLSVAHDHSFIAGGVAVHNCQFHHRGHGGAHVASASDFEGQHFVKGLIT